MTNLTPTPTWGATLRAPDNGEEVVAVSAMDPPPAGEGPIRPFCQETANRLQYLKARADYAAALPHERPYLWSQDLASIKVGPWTALDPTTITLLSIATEITVSVADLVPAAGAWPADAWVYLYGFDSGGGVARVLASVTAPTLDLTAMTGNASRRFLGAFRTSGTAVIPFGGSRTAGFRFDEPQSIFTGQNQTAWTTQSLAARVPPHAQLAQLLMTGVNTAQTTRTANLRPKGSTVTSPTVLRVGASCMVDAVPTYSDGIGQWSGDSRMNAAREIEYQVSHGSLSVSLYAMGWKE